uniref:15-hydroxyprostaglandin dehydrogenase [NAD(+)] n=1 Tax=Cacopsylla melanoneura TaxID=428564 RepID=A0A8D8UJF5_9HEMI
MEYYIVLGAVALILGISQMTSSNQAQTLKQDQTSLTWESHEERPYNVQIKDVVAIVTGGTKGLGKNFVEHLLKEHAKVAFGGTSVALGEKMEKQYGAEYGADKVMFCPLDVTKHESFENIFIKAKAKWGGVDLLVNNAGVGYEDKDNWERTIDINFKGSVRGQLLAVEHMGKHKGGRGGTVVMISSRTALIPGYLWPLYSTTKKAQLAYTEAMGDEFYEKHFNIRTMSLCPGLTDSDLPDYQGENPYIPELKPILGNRSLSATKQRPESVSKGLLQIIRNGTTGSIWLVENDESPRQIHFYNDF